MFSAKVHPLRMTKGATTQTIRLRKSSTPNKTSLTKAQKRFIQDLNKLKPNQQKSGKTWPKWLTSKKRRLTETVKQAQHEMALLKLELQYLKSKDASSTQQGIKVNNWTSYS